MLDTLNESLAKDTKLTKSEHLAKEHGYDSSQLSKFGDQCKNIRLRHIYFRLVSGTSTQKKECLGLG